MGSPSPLQDTSCCRSVMQTQLCPEGLWGGERPQPDLSVCEIRIDLQGLIWKAKLCTSFCMLRIISRFTITVSILAPGPWHEESCSPQVSLKLWGVLPSTLRGVSWGPQASCVTLAAHSSPPAQCQSQTKAGLFSAGTEVLLLRPRAAALFKRKCCSWQLDHLF